MEMVEAHRAGRSSYKSDKREAKKMEGFITGREGLKGWIVDIGYRTLTVGVGIFHAQDDLQTTRPYSVRSFMR